MTLKELSQLYYLKREIETDTERLERLKTTIENPRAAQITGMPHGGSGENRLERYVAEMVDLQAIISAKRDQCVHERARLERYIADVPDSMTRQILTLRFVDGLRWRQVADRIGGNNTEDGVRKACFRFVSREG